MLTENGKHLYVSHERYHHLIEKLALMVYESGWQFDTILCLARGGVRPGDILSRIFNLPLALLVLAKIGIISSNFLAKQRRVMIVVAFIIGGIITPTPDIFSQTMMAIPILVLYEASIWAVRILLGK